MIDFIHVLLMECIREWEGLGRRMVRGHFDTLSLSSMIARLLGDAVFRLDIFVLYISVHGRHRDIFNNESMHIPSVVPTL